MRRTARLMVVILVILAFGAGGLLWKSDAPDLPDPESPHLSLKPPGWDPDPEHDPDLDDLLRGGLLPGEEPDGALDVEEDHKMYDDY